MTSIGPEAAAYMAHNPITTAALMAGTAGAAFLKKDVRTMERLKNPVNNGTIETSTAYSTV